jgi:hypothetical protein
MLCIMQQKGSLTMNQDRVRQIVVVAAIVLQTVSAWVSGSGMLEIDQTDVSNSFSTYFTPAGITFAVWGLIYLGQIVYAVYQALPAQAARAIHRSTGWWAVSAAVANALWSPVFSQTGVYGTPEFQPLYLGLSLIIIVWLLISLLRIFLTLCALDPQSTDGDRWLVQMPFYGYFAWVNVAAIANTTLLLIGLGWTGEQNGALWSTVMIVVATVLASALILIARAKPGAVAFAAVIVWALAGIYLGNNDKSALVGVTALVAALVVLVVAVYRVWRRTPLPVAA